MGAPQRPSLNGTANTCTMPPTSLRYTIPPLPSGAISAPSTSRMLLAGPSKTTAGSIAASAWGTREKEALSTVRSARTASLSMMPSKRRGLFAFMHGELSLRVRTSGSDGFAGAFGGGGRPRGSQRLGFEIDLGGPAPSDEAERQLVATRPERLSRRLRHHSPVSPSDQAHMGTRGEREGDDKRTTMHKQALQVRHEWLGLFGPS